MSNVDGLLGSRIGRSAGTARLALGDLAVLVGFIVVGELRHGVSPVESPLVVADTLAPFLIGWLTVALTAGAYAPGATRTVRTAALRAGGAWIGAAVVGLALRSTALFHGGAPPAFATVVIGVGFVSFVGWRSAVAGLR